MKRGITNLGIIRTEWAPFISEELEKLSECDERLYYSPSVNIGGFDWRFTIDYIATSSTNSDVPIKYLGIFLHCSLDDSNIPWTCMATSEFTIFSNSSQFADVCRKSEEPDFYTSEETKGWGYNEFILWNELKDYVKNGVITLEVSVTVTESYGLYFSPHDLIEPNANIRIKEKKGEEIEFKLFYVNKEYLMEYSNYFKAAFNRDFEEKKSQCVELEDVNSENFDQLLQVLSPQRKPINQQNVEKLLILADRFEIMDLLYFTGRFLIKGRNNRKEKEMNALERLGLADKYQLHWAIKDITAETHLDSKDLMGNEKYEMLSYKSKVEILEEIALPQKRTRNIDVVRPFYSFYRPDPEIDHIKVNVKIKCNCSNACKCENIRFKTFYVNRGIILTFSEDFEERIKNPQRKDQDDKQKLLPRRTRKSHISSPDEASVSKKPKVEIAEHEETITMFTSDEFEELLRVIYPSRKSIREENVKSLLKVAQILKMPDVIIYCENFLISKLNNIDASYNFLELIVYVDEFELKNLMNEILKTINKHNLREMKREIKYVSLSHETKSMLFDRTIELL